MTEPTKRKTAARRRILPVVVIVLLAGVLGAVAWQQVRAAYTSAFMTATWSAAGGAGQITGRVTQWNGRPEVAQPVELTDDGGTHAITTDGDGRFSLDVAGMPSRLTLVGIDTIPLSRWNLPGGGGVAFDIRLKRPPPPSRGPL